MTDENIFLKKEKMAVQPGAWKPSETWDSLDVGEVVTEPSTDRISQWDDILINAGYDPELYEIVEPVKFSTWQQQSGEGKETLYSYRAGIRLKSNSQSIPYDDLIKEIKKHRKRQEFEEGDSTFVVNIADLQIGKSDGDGLRGTIARFLQMIDDVETRIRELKKSGRKLQRLVVAGLGDLVEGCLGSYPAQTFTVEANRREQVRILRRLLRDAIARWAKLFNEVIVTCVPGNHGRNDLNGKVFTNIGDNDDVAVFEALEEIFSANPEAYGHVSFLIPENEIYMTLDLHGTVVGFVHGHITKGGGTPQAKIKGWWEELSFNNQPISQASILVSAHYHHFSIIEYSKNRIHLQCPALDGGSEWWVNLTGQDSRPGTLTFVIDSNGYKDLAII